MTRRAWIEEVRGRLAREAEQAECSTCAVPIPGEDDRCRGCTSMDDRWEPRKSDLPLALDALEAVVEECETASRGRTSHYGEGYADCADAIIDALDRALDGGSGTGE